MNICIYINKCKYITFYKYCKKKRCIIKNTFQVRARLEVAPGLGG